MADPVLTHRLHLRDQLPRIGCGFRYVAAKIGRKWVHITSECGRVKTRIRIEAWHQITKEEV